MRSPRGPTWALCLALAAGIAGCQPRAEQSTTHPAPAETGDTTAWWKTEGAPVASLAVSLSGAPLPGWQKLPTVLPILATQGQKLFATKGCVSCHSIGKGRVVGPDLLGVTHRAEPEWVQRFVADPPAMLESDPRAKELLATYLVKMPQLHLKPDEIRALMEYFRQRDQAAAHAQHEAVGK